MSDITAQALEEARNGGNICSFCHGFGTQKQWHAQDFDSDPQGHHVYVKCDHCDGSGVEPTIPQPTTTLPQSEERPKKDVAFVSYVTAKIPPHPDTLQGPKLAPEGTPMAVFQKERTDAISEMFDNKYADGIYPTSRFFARLDNCVASLLSQEKERWENELREKVEGLMLRVAGFDSVREDEVYNAALSNVLALISKRKE